MVVPPWLQPKIDQHLTPSAAAGTDKKLKTRSASASSYHLTGNEVHGKVTIARGKPKPIPLTAGYRRPITSRKVYAEFLGIMQLRRMASGPKRTRVRCKQGPTQSAGIRDGLRNEARHGFKPFSQQDPRLGLKLRRIQGEQRRPILYRHAEALRGAQRIARKGIA
jgi:hypothetical protein